jgi:hypothetical protein
MKNGEPFAGVFMQIIYCEMFTFFVMNVLGCPESSERFLEK